MSFGTQTWTPIESWAFEGADRDWCSDNAGPDEDMMRRWLELHKDEYKPGEMTPEEALAMAGRAINQEQWDKANAYATAGLLSLMIGAMKGLLKVGNEDFSSNS